MRGDREKDKDASDKCSLRARTEVVFDTATRKAIGKKDIDTGKFYPYKRRGRVPDVEKPENTDEKVSPSGKAKNLGPSGRVKAD